MEASALHAPARTPRISLSASLLGLRSDDQLVALFRAGDEAAFGIIHDRYRPRLIAYARQMLRGSRPDAEDAVQDVFLRTHAALRANGRPIALRAWLYRVAHNRCIDQLRRPAETPTEELELPVSAPGPETEAERRDQLRRLVDDVRRLPGQQRSALLMRELEGLSYADLAQALDVTVPAVKSLLVRARIGLVEAADARDTDCRQIRSDLALAHRRGVRSSGLARRHVRDCDGCREFRGQMRKLDRALASVPFASPGIMAKLLGLGGGSAVAAGGAAGGAGMAAGSGVATGGMAALGLTTAKVVAVVATAALATGGAVAINHKLDTGPPAAVRASGALTPGDLRSQTSHAELHQARATAAAKTAATGRRPRPGASAGPATGHSRAVPAPPSTPAPGNASGSPDLSGSAASANAGTGSASTGSDHNPLRPLLGLLGLAGPESSAQPQSGVPGSGSDSSEGANSPSSTSASSTGSSSGASASAKRPSSGSSASATGPGASTSASSSTP